MRYSDKPTVDELTNIIRGMGIEYSLENVDIITKVLREHPDEEIAGAILRYTDLVKYPCPSRADFDRWGIEMQNTPWQKCYSRKYCLEIVKNVPVTCLQELFDNAESIQKWLEGDI